MCTVGGMKPDGVFGRTKVYNEPRRRQPNVEREALFSGNCPNTRRRQYASAPRNKCYPTCAKEPDSSNTLPPKRVTQKRPQKRNPSMGWSRPQTVMPKAASPDVETQEPPLPLRNDGRRICERGLASGIQSRRARPESA
ncbi:hypothetical protein IscW_ISCW009368 [Ixodes scapularis]|uniref:Uncharacterized protein n=1 Tax=Ixodes scapularis TaxID=6945 RepID=B7PYE8_IXOSC|nr:hypothetical protein IscW_ISCW009368 [Ixodes scapularis]|eukprot:XP_002403044.1 hypothetical protein IscW_ISCW009368 [Ixodes scapularis]